MNSDSLRGSADGADRAIVYAWGFSRYKRPLVESFLADRKVVFPRSPRDIPAGATLALWGRAAIPIGAGAALNILRLEDGFLRSVGLGADLVRPLSWVVESSIHYDPSVPSDLERQLNAMAFSEALLARAAALRHIIVTGRFTKYNVGGRLWKRSSRAQHVVLAVGQVESDASIRWGTNRVRNNLELLRAVRDRRPDAYVLYKLHPDVAAGLRRANDLEQDAVACCDEIVSDCDMATLLHAVDEVHVMTSLAGFEALLRGKPVTTYGMPFYAGWGLTTDLDMRDEVAQRRQRKLSVDELVAASLITYPRYRSTRSGQLTSPEIVLKELADRRERQDHRLSWLHRWLVRPALRWAARRDGR